MDASERKNNIIVFGGISYAFVSLFVRARVCMFYYELRDLIINLRDLIHSLINFGFWSDHPKYYIRFI